jgi:hypothetical protein
MSLPNLTLSYYQPKLILLSHPQVIFVRSLAPAIFFRPTWSSRTVVIFLRWLVHLSRGLYPSCLSIGRVCDFTQHSWFTTSRPSHYTLHHIITTTFPPTFIIICVICFNYLYRYVTLPYPLMTKGSYPLTSHY